MSCFGGLASADPEWWNTSFSSRIPITITTNGTSTPAWYQVLVNITYDSAMQDDFDDIRFTNSTGGTELSYWIESKVNGSYANVWVNLSDAITHPGSDTIWMYYGNAGLSDGGVGDDTFIAYHGAASASFGDSYIVTPSNVIFEASVEPTAATHTVRVGLRNTAYGTNDDFMELTSYTGDDKCYFAVQNEGTQSYVSEAPDLDVDVYSRLKTIITGATWRAYVNDNEISTGITTNLPDEVMGLYFELSTGTGNQAWSFVRKYIANESTSSVGTAQYNTNNSLHYNATTNYNHTIESDGTITANHTVYSADDTNDTASSIGTSYLIINAYNNSASIVRNFTITGDVLDWYQAANLSGDYTLNNGSGVLDTQSDVSGEVNFTGDLMAGEYWIEEVVDDTSFTVTLPAGQTQINFSAVKSIDTLLQPDGQTSTVPMVVVENTGNIAQLFRFYMNSTVSNILTYTSLSSDLSNPVEINTTTTTVIISNLAASGSDNVWMYCNLTRPSPGSSEKTLTINSS